MHRSTTLKRLTALAALACLLTVLCAGAAHVHVDDQTAAFDCAVCLVGQTPTNSVEAPSVPPAGEVAAPLIATEPEVPVSSGVTGLAPSRAPPLSIEA